MNVGTKSVLWGAHCFFIHPWFVALAWWKLYGFPCDPRLWVAFFVHDLGLWGCPNMDGPEGERHVEWGAQFMRRWFGDEWGDLCLYHSRFYSKRDNTPPSRLCAADKLAMCLEPWWFYIPRAWASGEVWEYIHLNADHYGKYKLNGGTRTDTIRHWFDDTTDYLYRWVQTHRDGGPDTWTWREREEHE